MRKLFWGFVFIYLNFTLQFNQFALNIIPDFVGYIFLFMGMKELETEERTFRYAKPLAVAMSIYTALLWGGTLMGMPNAGVVQLLDLIAAVAALYISWALVQMILRLEKETEADLYGTRMYRWWKGLAVVQICGKAVYFLTGLVNFGILGGIMAVLTTAGMVLVVLYLLSWNRSTVAYQALEKQKDIMSE